MSIILCERAYNVDWIIPHFALFFINLGVVDSVLNSSEIVLFKNEVRFLFLNTDI